MNHDWKDGEFRYCYSLVASRGDDSVGRDPKSIATYLRLQANDACRAGEWQLSARLGSAATAINEDARNNHEPNWNRARILLDLRDPAPHNMRPGAPAL